MRSNPRGNPRFNKKDIRLPLVLILGAVMLFLIAVMPKQPVAVAVNGSGDPSASSHTGLRITEVMSDNKSTLPDENGAFGDWIEITNTTDRSMNIKDVGLSDRNDRIKFLFPDMTMAPGERVLVFCDGTNADDPLKTLHAKMKLSSYGDSVFLFDAGGVAIDQVLVPTLNTDESYLLNEDGTWERSVKYSPGYENTVEGHDAFIANFSVIPGVLMINEIMAAPRTGIRDEDGDLSDWVELYNASDNPIALSGFALSDDDTRPVKWTFPAGAVIAPHSCYLVFCSGKDKLESTTMYPHTNFSISAEREVIVLSTVTGQLVDRVTVEGLGKDMTYGRDPVTLEWKVFTLGTPGVVNDAEGMRLADDYLRAINNRGVFISEVMASADATIPIKGAESSDWAEIYNATDQYVDISGWGLSDSVNWPRKWTFPLGTVIYPGEYKVILLDKSVSAGSDSSRLHANFALSRAGGEMMVLSDASGMILDRLYLPEIPTDYSYGRTWGSAGFFYYDAVTPGSQNAGGFRGFAAAPSFTVASGLYRGTVTVGIENGGTGTLRYTLDGSVPTADNSMIYEGPITLKTTAVIRARNFAAGLQPSATVSASYIMNTYYTLDVVSLIIDPDELWNSETGLLTVGENVDKSRGIPYRNTVYRTWGKVARPAYVDYMLQSTGSAVISQGIKMDLMGDYSLDMPQKSMKIRANAAGGKKYFEYPLFEERPFSFYKSFTLRNSGNDCVWTRVADGVQTRLIDKYIGSDIITLAWKPVIVYINGAYWGHYNMRERKDEYCIAQHEGFSLDRAKEINIIRANSSVVQGPNTDYLTMRDKITASSPNTSDADRNYLDENIDIDSYLDWFAIKMFFGDSDPGNIMFYRIPGGKWKCLIFDLDYGLFRSNFNSPYSYMKETGMGEQKINNVIFRKILEVDEYRDLFLRKLGGIYQSLSTERMQAELDECVAIIQPEMGIHFERWAEFNDKKINSDSPLSPDGAMRYWKTRVARMRDQTMVNRPYYIYTFTQETFGLTDQDMLYYFGEKCPPKPES